MTFRFCGKIICFISLYTEEPAVSLSKITNILFWIFILDNPLIKFFKLKLQYEIEHSVNP